MLSVWSAGRSCAQAYETGENKHLKRMSQATKTVILREAHSIWEVDVSAANRGELWVSDSPEAMADSCSQSLENLEEDAVYKTHVEKDFIAFCSSTPRMYLSVADKNL